MQRPKGNCVLRFGEVVRKSCKKMIIDKVEDNKSEENLMSKFAKRGNKTICPALHHSITCLKKIWLDLFIGFLFLISNSVTLSRSCGHVLMIKNTLQYS